MSEVRSTVRGLALRARLVSPATVQRSALRAVVFGAGAVLLLLGLRDVAKVGDRESGREGFRRVVRDTGRSDGPGGRR